MEKSAYENKIMKDQLEEQNKIALETQQVVERETSQTQIRRDEVNTIQE